MGALSDHVRHEDRQCATHGRTLHSLYYVGRSETPRWCCLQCEAARVKARKAAGEPTRERRTKAPQSRPAVCPVCFLVLTASGVCPDECTS